MPRHAPAPGSRTVARRAAAQEQPPEFDHAINYVTKIKQRFANDGRGTYKRFLEILHTYQKEQRSIKDVLDQVSDLFLDHPDLLREFTYFLPDAVQEEAKARLMSAAAMKRARQPLRDQGRRDMAKAREKRGKRRRGAAERGEDMLAALPAYERDFFEKVKRSLLPDVWLHFLRVLDLYSQEVLSRAEMLTLVADLLAAMPALVAEFQRVLASRGLAPDPLVDACFSMPLSEVDFSQCRRCTPSYRALPAGFPHAPCSSRSGLDSSVLNDDWVSVPTGSEGSTFKVRRRCRWRRCACAATLTRTEWRDRACGAISTRRRCSGARTSGSRWTWCAPPWACCRSAPRDVQHAVDTDRPPRRCRSCTRTRPPFALSARWRRRLSG